MTDKEHVLKSLELVRINLTESLEKLMEFLDDEITKNAKKFKSYDMIIIKLSYARSVIAGLEAYLRIVENEDER